MKTLTLSLVAMLTLAAQSEAAVLKLDAGDKQIENVNIAKSGEATVEGRKSALTAIGAGLRKKKVAIVKVNVYVAQLLGSDAAKFKRDMNKALESIDAMKAVAIQMNFLRTVDAETVEKSYMDSLEKNNVNLAAPAIRAFLNAVKNGGEAVDGKTLVILGEKLADGAEAVTYENTKGDAVTVRGEAGFVKAIFSIWLGNTTDAQLEDLKKSIVEGN